MVAEGIESSGYSEEERYFHEKERELLKKKRQDLDAARAQQKSAATKHAHWMKCPKCGEEMEEIKMESIMVDKCTGCEGVYFDSGELELLIEDRKGGFVSSLRKLFG